MLKVAVSLAGARSLAEILDFCISDPSCLSLLQSEAARRAAALHSSLTLACFAVSL